MHTRPSLSLIIALISSLVALVGGSSSSGAGRNNLMALCRGEELEIRTVSQFHSIAYHLYGINPAECNDKVRRAVKDMAEIARDGSACTMQKAQAITKFVNDYLNGESGSELGARTEFPKALTKFAVAYGLRVSNKCKEYLMNDFILRADRQLERRFQANLNRLKNYMLKYSPLGSLLLPLYKTADVLLPSDLMQLVPGLREEVVGLVPKGKDLANLKMVCERLFRPLYEPLLLPLAHLIRAGFNYLGESSHPNSHKSSAQFWFVTAFLCETVKTIETRNRAGESAGANFGGVASMTSSSPGKISRAAERERKFFLQLLEEHKNSWELIRLIPNVEVGDEISNGNESSFNQLVESFDAHKNKADRLRELLLDRSRAVFMAVCRRGGKTGGMMKKLLGSLRANSDKELEEVKESLLELASDHVDN